MPAAPLTHETIARMGGHAVWRGTTAAQRSAEMSRRQNKRWKRTRRERIAAAQRLHDSP